MTTPSPETTFGARLIQALFVGLIIYAGAFFNFLGLRPLVIAMAVFVGVLGIALWLLPALRRDGRPTRLAYLVCGVAGLLAGLSFGVTSPSPRLPYQAFTGTLFGLSWVWIGHFLREPFGSTPWPPYPKD